jgi:hypothetical protein
VVEGVLPGGGEFGVAAAVDVDGGDADARLGRGGAGVGRRGEMIEEELLARRVELDPVHAAALERAVALGGDADGDAVVGRRERRAGLVVPGVEIHRPFPGLAEQRVAAARAVQALEREADRGGGGLARAALAQRRHELRLHRRVDRPPPWVGSSPVHGRNGTRIEQKVKLLFLSGSAPPAAFAA